MPRARSASPHQRPNQIYDLGLAVQACFAQQVFCMGAGRVPGAALQISEVSEGLTLRQCQSQSRLCLCQAQRYGELFCMHYHATRRLPHQQRMRFVAMRSGQHVRRCEWQYVQPRMRRRAAGG